MHGPTVPKTRKQRISGSRPNWWKHPDAPWDTTTIQLWVDKIDEVPWRSDGAGGYWKTLACPRCTHQVTFELRGGPVIRLLWDMPGDIDWTQDRTGALRMSQGSEAAPDTAAADSAERTPVECNCETNGATHPGRPDRFTEGCGQNGWIKRP